MTVHQTSTEVQGSNQQGTDTEINSVFYFTVASKRKIRITTVAKLKCHHNTIRLIVRSNHYLDLVHSILGKWVNDKEKEITSCEYRDPLLLESLFFMQMLA